MHFQPSYQVADFNFIRLLNEGAFAKVYEVEKKDNSQRYAIKVSELILN